MDQIVYVDMRCFQSHEFRFLNSSQRFLFLLRARLQSSFANWKTVGLIDRSLPDLAVEVASYLSDVSTCLNPCFSTSVPAIFIDGAPMTQDMRFSLRFLGQDSMIAAAIAYDFQPLDSQVVSQRIEHVARLARLRNFDLVFPGRSEAEEVWTGIESAVRHVSAASKNPPCIAFLGSDESSTLAPLLGNYNAIVPVLESADSDPHTVEFLRRYGGPAILHGAELPETLIGRVSPLIYCPAVSFNREELSRRSRSTMRERLGIASSSFLVSNFGSVSEAAIIAIDFLRSWNIPADLYLVGDSINTSEIYRIANLFGISGHIHIENAGCRRDFLVASDAAIQTCSQDHSLIDCIAAGLPCVTTGEMAASSAAPFYVSQVPNHFSPLHIAEQLALIWEARGQMQDHENERLAYLETHNFEYYQSRMTEILDLA